MIPRRNQKAVVIALAVSFIFLAATNHRELLVEHGIRRKTRASPQKSVRRTSVNQTHQFSLNRGYHFLVLGGSTSWGASVHPHESYASVIRELHPDNRVDNFAIRATGTGYNSLCAQTIIEKGLEDDVSAMVYDVILLEFSINGIQNLDLLSRRLRRRYPDAKIIYIHLYSLNTSHIRRKTKDRMLKKLHRLMGRVDGKIYQLPFPEHDEGDTYDAAMSLFADDLTHLSGRGHDLVATEVMKIVENHAESIPQTPALGTWGAGDQCYFWFMTGQFEDTIKMSGGTFTEFDFINHKYAFEVRQGQVGRIKFEMKGSAAMEDLHVAYLTKGNPSLYPKTRLMVEPHDDTITLDPFNERWAENHVTDMVKAGEVKLGHNTLVIEPLETTPFPTRIAGIAVCGACREMDRNGRKIASILSA